MRPRAIFFDDGGVLNDNALRGPAWERLVAEYLTPRLGGAHAAWGEANRDVFRRQWQRFEAWLAARTENDGWADFFSAPDERERWLREMCEQVGVAAPSFDECVALAAETESYVLPRVRAAYPDAADAVRAVARAGYRLSTASGHTSSDLEYSLGNMGVRHLFGEHLYGGDLVAQVKDGQRFYEGIFAHAAVAPSEALVLDDSPRAVAWVTRAGARAVLVARDGRQSPPGVTAIRSLLELPALLD